MPAAVAETQPVAAIGARVRALRESMGLSLRDLAQRTGVSAPMLSQVERGEASPTLAVATRIAGGLDLTLSQLLRLDEDRHLVITRRGEGRARDRARPPRRGAEPARCPASAPRSRCTRSIPAPPRAAPATRRSTSPGSRETLHVESARSCSGSTATRTSSPQGDSATFDADLPHHFENPGEKEARLLAVVSAGLRSG